MAANINPIFEEVPKVYGQTFVNADSTTVKDIVTGGTDGTRIDSIMVSSDDTSAVNLAFHLHDGSTNWYIGNVNVPIGSGYTTVARVEALSILAPVIGYLVVPNGWKLRANAVAAVTAAKTCSVVAMGGDY